MATISENLQTIIDIKADIKTAIENKGVTVGDTGFGEYAGKIESITTGLNFTSLNYTDVESTTVNDLLQDAIQYSENLGTNITNTTFKYDKSLIFCPRGYVMNSDMSYSFSDAMSLIYVPTLTILPGVTLSNTSNMFDGCFSLKQVDVFPTHNVINMKCMFYDCQNLLFLPDFDFSKVNNTSQMLYNCKSLTEINDLEMPLNQSVEQMFYNCSLLHTIGEINAPLANAPSSLDYPFINCVNLTNFGGWLNAGNYVAVCRILRFSNSDKLTYQSCMNIINKAADRTIIDGAIPSSIVFHATPYALLSYEDIAIATSKGWSVQAA